MLKTVYAGLEKYVAIARIGKTAKDNMSAIKNTVLDFLDLNILSTDQAMR